MKLKLSLREASTDTTVIIPITGTIYHNGNEKPKFSEMMSTLKDLKCLFSESVADRQ